jgi:hypothetical protein
MPESSKARRKHRTHVASMGALHIVASRPFQYADTQGERRSILSANATILIGPRPRIAVDVKGDGPLLIFLHGIGGNRSNWRDQLPVFAALVWAVAEKERLRINGARPARSAQPLGAPGRLVESA